MQEIVTENFREALVDYFYLLNRDYSPKSSLKLVSDRRGLDRIQRNILFRGVTDASTAERRKKLLVTDPDERHMMIDTYNVVFTVCNYLLGRAVYIANDGFLRDAGEVFGKPPRGEVTQKSVDLVFGFLSDKRPESVLFLLDSPVSHSGLFAGELREQLRSIPLSGDARVVPSPDYYLKRADHGLVATSDSVVLDRVRIPVVDMARLIIEYNFSPSFIRIDRLL